MFAGRRRISSMADQVRRVVHSQLSRGIVTIDSISAKLGLHPRALQRLLDQEQTSYADLLNEVRRDLATRYLTDSDQSLLEIGMALGYSTQSSFSRWFAAEFGQPPASWRREFVATAKLRPPSAA